MNRQAARSQGGEDTLAAPVAGTTTRRAGTIPTKTIQRNERTAMPALVKFYLTTYRVFGQLVATASACFTGVWLGLLPRRVLDGIDAAYYDQQRYYRTNEYNRRGLWPWEQRAIDTHFVGCRSLLVAAVGGGREVLALRQRGLDVDGFECNAGLARFANNLLKENGQGTAIRLALRDTCPDFARTYDGLVVGWAAYMLIRGHHRRIEFLRQLRRYVEPGAPILLSFFHRAGEPRRYRMAAGIGTALASLLRRERVEVGDSLEPNFVHYFTPEELDSELRAGGFEPVFFGTDEYGHAVGRAG